MAVGFDRRPRALLPRQDRLDAVLSQHGDHRIAHAIHKIVSRAPVEVSHRPLVSLLFRQLGVPLAKQPWRQPRQHHVCRQLRRRGKKPQHGRKPQFQQLARQRTIPDGLRPSHEFDERLKEPRRPLPGEDGPGQLIGMLGPPLQDEV